MMDIETAKEIKHSRLWDEICKELDMLIRNEEGKLRACGEDQLKKIQLKINFLEEMKRLPQDVIDRG